MSYADKIASSCPIALTEQIIALLDPSPQADFLPGAQANKLPVEQPIKVIWLLESNATIVFTHGGKVIKEGSTYNDFHGFLTSMDAAVEAMQQNAESYSVLVDSSLEISVAVSLFAVPCYQTDENHSESNDYSKRGSRLRFYSRYPHNLQICGHHYNNEATFLERHLLKEVTFTSSKATTPEQEEALNNMKRSLYLEFLGKVPGPVEDR